MYTSRINPSRLNAVVARGWDPMKFEVIESRGEWIVRRDGVELARYGEQLEALADIAERLHDTEETAGVYSLAMRYQARP